MATKPGTLPRWARTTGGVDSGAIVAPTSGEQDSGLAAGQKWTAQKANWLFNWLYQWVAWLNDSPTFAPATSSAVAASFTAGGGGTPTRGALNLTPQAQPSAPQAGDVWIGTDGQMRFGAAGAVLPPALAFLEDFEAATFPPTARPGWATPSPRFPSDLSWNRTTTNPIAGTASASAPVPQGISTNSSLGLTFTLLNPARISFLFAVNCIQNNGDHLDFYVDGVLTAQLSTQVSNTLVGGKFITDLLREGLHTFDWRFVRGGSASVGAEECKIDTVEIISDEAVRSDPTRVLVFDEGFLSMNGAISNIALYSGSWFLVTNSNPGAVVPRTPSSLQVMGAFQLSSGAVGAGDGAVAVLQMAAISNAYSLSALVEARIYIPTLSANEIVEVGWTDNGVHNSGFGWAWDGSLGVGSTWRWRGTVLATDTTLDSGVAIAATTWFRLGVITATVRGVSSAVFTKDGKALPGAGSIPPLMTTTTGLPTTAGPTPGFKVRSVTAAFAAAAILDWMRVLMLRP